MKTKEHLTLWLIALFLGLMGTTLHARGQYDFKAGDLYYKKTSANEVRVVIPYESTYGHTPHGYGPIGYPNELSGTVTIPETVTNNGTTYTVTSLRDSVFAWCKNIEAVIIPKTVKKMERSTFEGCEGLRNITVFWNTPLSIPPYQFYGVTLSQITLHVPAGTANAYRGVSPWNQFGNIVDDVLNPNQPSNPGNAMTGTTGDLTWKYDKQTKTLTISGQGEMPNYKDRTVPWENFREEMEYLVIEEGATYVGYDAFRNCHNLKSISLPESVIEIDNMAFRECVNLTSVTIPAGVKDISPGVFGACLKLTSIMVDEGNTNFTSVDGVLFNKGKTVLVQFPGGKSGKYIIPSSVNTIYNQAFVGCENLESVSIPADIRKVYWDAFYGCKNLIDVTIKATKLPWMDVNIFTEVPFDRAVLHVPAGMKSTYAKTYPWSDFGTIVEDADNPSQPQPQPGEPEWPSNITNDDGTDYYVSSIAPATFVQPVSGDTPCPNGNFTAYGRNNLVAGAVVETGGTVCIVIKPVNNTGKFTKAGTAYIKQGDVCGTPLAEATYAVGDKQVVLRLKPNFTYGSRTYVPMIKTAAGGERFYTRPITITCKAKVGYIDDPALSMHPRITTAGTSIEARGDMFSRGATVKLQFSGPTDITATDITTDATGHFAYSFTLPATAKSGYYTVTAIEPSTGRTKTSRFQVTPAEDPSTPTPTPKSALELIAPIGSQTIYSGENLDLSWKDAVNLEADRKNGGRKYKIEASIDGGPWQFITDVTDNTVHSDGETVTYNEQYDPEHKSALRSALEGHALRSGRTDFTFKLKVIKDGAVGAVGAAANAITTEVMSWKTKYDASNYPILLEWDREDDPKNTPLKVKLKGVAADGVSCLRIAMPNKLGDRVITGVEVTLSDDMGSGVTSILGSIIPCKKKPVGYADAELAHKSAESVTPEYFLKEKTTATTLTVNEDGFFRFWYIAPEDFMRIGEYLTILKRIVYANCKLTLSNSEIVNVKREIEIVRPPLMLVHGLNGNADTWKHFALKEKVLTGNVQYKDDERFKVAIAPNMAPVSHFELNANHLLDKVTNDRSMMSVIYRMRQQGYACNQVDYVCHSMGGSILRRAEEKKMSFYRHENYKKGFVHKFITLHTPHNGSSFANFLCDENIRRALHEIGAKKDFFYEENGSYKPYSAILDLRYKDGIKFPETKLKAHLVAGGTSCFDEGTYRYILSLLYDNYNRDEKARPGLILLLSGLYKYAISSDRGGDYCNLTTRYFSENNLESDFMDLSDGIVSLNSQFSASPKTYTIDSRPTNTSFFPGIMHTGMLDNGLAALQPLSFLGDDPTNRLKVGKLVNELLNAPLSSPLFNSIPATKAKLKSATRRASTETKPRLRSAEPGKVKIESPGVGDTYRPGETVTVKIKVDTENLAGLFLSFQDQVVEVESPISEMEVRMQVGDEQTETQEIHATALYRTGQEMAIGSDSRTVVVKSPDNATSLEVSPRTLVMEKGTSRRPEYTALYTGSRSELGNTPDIAVTIDNPAIASYDAATNTFKGLSAGKTYAVATWRGLTRTFVVDVMEDVTPPSDPVEDPTPTPTPTPTPSPSTPATPPVASNVHPTAVTIEPSSIALSEGKTTTLKAVVTPANASNRAVSWSTSDASVATVDNLGLVTALKSGTATITATTNDGGLKATCSVTVTNHVGNLAVPGGVSVWSSAGRLHVQSPAKETIEVFDFAGKLLLRADKAAGEAVYDLDMPAGVTIVKGSSGWTRKVKN